MAKTEYNQNLSASLFRIGCFSQRLWHAHREQSAARRKSLPFSKYLKPSFWASLSVAGVCRAEAGIEPDCPADLTWGSSAGHEGRTVRLWSLRNCTAFNANTEVTDRRHLVA